MINKIRTLITDYGDLIAIIVAAIVIVIALYFGLRQVVYCLQATGQPSCTIVVTPVLDSKPKSQ